MPFVSPGKTRRKQTFKRLLSLVISVAWIWHQLTAKNFIVEPPWTPPYATSVCRDNSSALLMGEISILFAERKTTKLAAYVTIMRRAKTHQVMDRRRVEKALKVDMSRL